MPNRFNDRENGESSYFPRRHREHNRPYFEQQSRPERRGWESNQNESTEDRGIYGPAPQHTRRGKDIQESHGGYSGQQYERGVYGYESRNDEEFDRRRPYNPGYAFDRYDTSGQRHSQYEQGPYFGKGPKNYRRSDQRIEEDINERLTQHPFIDATNIEVRVQNGNVQLSGTVDDRNAKRIAEDIVDSVSGVKEIENQIRYIKKY
jgi:osmotically-inducible protein OsmY